MMNCFFPQARPLALPSRKQVDVQSVVPWLSGRCHSVILPSVTELFCVCTNVFTFLYTIFKGKLIDFECYFPCQVIHCYNKTY